MTQNAVYMLLEPRVPSSALQLNTQWQVVIKKQKKQSPTKFVKS